MKLVLQLFLILNTTVALADVHWGKKVKVGDGHARTFINLKGHKPKEIGIALSKAALRGLSQHEMAEYVLPMPKGVHVRPYKHVTLDWNPHGHEPDTIYTKPHFDMHFYFISNSFRQKITCMGEDQVPCMKEPGRKYIPEGYGPTPGGVPKMGWHWVDLRSPEFNGGEFTRTFIYGYYNGELTFIEPMVTLEYLKSRETSVKKVRKPKLFPYQGGSFPGQYKVYYDHKSKLHKIVLKDF